MTISKKYYIRFSSMEDHDKIMKFYAENPHDNLCGRQQGLVERLADNGSIILIEDAENGQIVGASISYPLTVREGDLEAYKWIEIGTTRMVLNGYPGLFDAMIGLQMLRAYLVEPPTSHFVAQMESKAVSKMACRIGFRPLTPTDELVSVSDQTLEAADGASCGHDNWYAVSVEMLPILAKALSEALDKPHLEHLKTGEKIHLDFSQSKFFSLFEEDIRMLADQSFGDPDQPDYSRGLAKHRTEWMRKRFK